MILRMQIYEFHKKNQEKNEMLCEKILLPNCNHLMVCFCKRFRGGGRMRFLLKYRSKKYFKFFS